MKDNDTFEQSMMELFDSLAAEHPEFIDRILARRSVQKRLEGLTPKERLEGLAPEDLLRCLSPAQREQLKRLLR